MDFVRGIMTNKRLMKYFVMAVIIVGIELVTFQVIYQLTKNYYLATVVSFLTGVILNWIVGRLLVFGKSKHSPLREFTMVFIASIGGLAIQVAVVFISVQLLLLYPLIGKMLSIIFSFFWNYWFRAAIIYKQPGTSKKYHNPVYTKYVTKIRQLAELYPRRTTLLLFIMIGLIASFIFFLRFPNNLFEANFYAEDGSVYLNNIESYGFIRALFTTFNGYFVSGLYMLEGVGYVLNAVLFHNSFLDLPKSFAIVSYLFLGFTTALPLLLFRRHFNPLALLLVVLLSAFIPMPGYDYAIIGTIGNLKFIFVYIAFLLLIYRHFIPETNWKRFISIDILILISGYTNIVVYLLMPFALLRYWGYMRPNKKKLLNLLHLHSFQSLLVLGILLIPQLIVVKIFGIPSIPGYLDTPYQLDATINTFVYRTYLFPFLPGVTSYLNDILVIITFVILNVILWFGMKGKRIIYVFGILAAFFITLLFVLNRTGVTELFKTYLSSGPDQFFYTQNLIVCFLLAIALVNLMRKILIIQAKAAVSLLLIAGITALYIPVAGSYGENDFMQRTVRNIYINAQIECKNNQGTPDLQLYPVTSNDFPLKSIERGRICTHETANYVPDTQYFSFDSLAGVYIADIQPANIKQTFEAEYDGLSGISVMFLTYKQDINDQYTLNLYKNDCKTKIRSATVSSGQIKDTKYARINFNKISGSKNTTYCFGFSVKQPKTKALALALSKENLYSAGELSTNNAKRSDDALIRLHYTK